MTVSRVIRPTLCALAMLSAFAVSTMAQSPEQGDGLPVGESFVYGTSGGKPRKLEIHFPPGHDRAKASVPGLILFHGGGWSGGTPAQFRAACAYFASRGMVAATAEYRMLTKDEAAKLPPGESRKRVCVDDARAAIRWMKSNARLLGIDPARIVAGGGSAGGHVSVLATTNPGKPGAAEAKVPDTSVVAYLLFNPAFTADDSADSEIDALRHARAGFPPAIVFFGTNDQWKTGWDQLRDKLQGLGASKIRVMLAKGQPHGFFNKEPWRASTLIEADRFLGEIGLIAGSPALTPMDENAKLVPELPAKPGDAKAKQP